MRLPRLLPTALVLALAAFAVRAQTAPHAALIEIDGAIGPAVAEHVVNGLAKAGRDGAAAVVLRLDTPGGLERSMRAIDEAILGSPVPVLCWVGPPGARAASAGTFILYACHVAAMAPGTNVGAATPIALGGDKATDDPARDKVINDAVAHIRSLAEVRGRNAEWAEKAVREAASLPASQALAANVIDLMADSVPDLLAKTDGRRVEVNRTPVVLATADLTLVRIEPSLRTRVLSVLASPEVAYLLMLVGTLGLLFELMSPGAVVPGILGGIALLAGLYSVALLPVDFAGLGLMLFGLALMAAEAFAPSFGILGLGGIAAFALGSLMLFDTGVPGYELSVGLIAGATAVAALVLVVGLAAALRSRRGRPVSGGEALVGATATVADWAGTAGHVSLMGELWNARADRPLARGDAVRVSGRHGLALVVEPVPKQPAPTGRP